MKEIVVLGCGEAGLNFSKTLWDNNSDFKLTVIDRLPYYFNKKEWIESLTPKTWTKLKDFATKYKIDFILDKVERVNPSRHKVYLKEGEPVGYDILVVASGFKSNKIEVKGDHREGFFYLSDIEPFKVKDLLRISQEMVVCVSTILGLKLAISLYGIGKDVQIICNNLDFLGEQKEKFIELCRQKNIIVYTNCICEEVIGEGVVKAVKLNPLKVISSQLVFVDSGFSPNFDFFEEAIEIKDTFFTNFSDIFFLGDVNGIGNDMQSSLIFNNENVQQQVKMLADFILGNKINTFTPRVVSEIDLQNNIQEMLTRLEAINIEKKTNKGWAFQV